MWSPVLPSWEGSYREASIELVSRGITSPVFRYLECMAHMANALYGDIAAHPRAVSLPPSIGPSTLPILKDAPRYLVDRVGGPMGWIPRRQGREDPILALGYG